MSTTVQMRSSGPVVAARDPKRLIQISNEIVETADRTGQPAGAVRYESQLALPNAYLRLYFTVSDPIRVESHSIEQEIRLTTTRLRFGGVRWWFICPHSGARVGRLHLPPGSSRFAARRAHGLRLLPRLSGDHIGP